MNRTERTKLSYPIGHALFASSEFPIINPPTVDELVKQLNIQPLAVIEGITNLKMLGIISLEIFKRSIAMVQANNALQEKITAIIWDSRIKPEEKDSSKE